MLITSYDLLQKMYYWLTPDECLFIYNGGSKIFNRCNPHFLGQGPMLKIKVFFFNLLFPTRIMFYMLTVEIYFNIKLLVLSNM